MDRLLLMNYDLWKEMMFFNPITGDYDIVERNDALTQAPLNGSFIEADGWVTLFYKVDGRLFFATKGQIYDLQEGSCSVHFERKGTNNEFRIEIAGKTVYSRLYLSYWYNPIHEADVTFDDAEEENQDFHLFVYRVMQDPSWQDRIYSHSQSV